MAGIVEIAYMAAALCFIYGLKRLSGVRTARSGNLYAALGMLLAVAATYYLLEGFSPWVLWGGLATGAAIGAVMAVRVQMTGMPELVALFNGLGGAASAAVALAEILRFANPIEELGTSVAGAVSLPGGGGVDFAIALLLSVLIGAVTLSGSLVAYAKLAGKLDQSRVGPLGSKAANAALALACLGLGWWAGFQAHGAWTIELSHALLAVLALALGIGLVVPIGGADMPVVISLLNSYSGLAACATGFVLQNNLLIVAGSLVGASGLILTRIMCKAMNRSLWNVLFATFGETAPKDQSGYTSVKSASVEEAAAILEGSRLVIVVPGYGMAVAQAQHKVRELATLLEKKGCEVRYAIHPVAGRMPGHMNVLLAEADVPYEQLYELDQINDEFANADAAIVLGANDVCNPAAEKDPSSPIAGMPVLQVWNARTVFVIKRSLSAGYAGIKNELFQLDNSLMLFGDGKEIVEGLVKALKEL